MTLWDKEDMAVRMVLEEGKLNMCLRVLQGRSAHTPGADHAHPPTRRAHSTRMKRATARQPRRTHASDPAQ
jgi:hypothetical protein